MKTKQFENYKSFLVYLLKQQKEIILKMQASNATIEKTILKMRDHDN
tara:strand:- start:262 stop:402 length:141 start_codon:yes stop_codon:yes gene_type:complete